VRSALIARFTLIARRARARARAHARASIFEIESDKHGLDKQRDGILSASCSNVDEISGDPSGVREIHRQ
jgi:hypothetical protein